MVAPQQRVHTAIGASRSSYVLSGVGQTYVVKTLRANHPRSVIMGTPVAIKSAATGGPKKRIERKVRYGHCGHPCVGECMRVGCTVLDCILLKIPFEACICTDQQTHFAYQRHIGSFGKDIIIGTMDTIEDAAINGRS